MYDNIIMDNTTKIIILILIIVSIFGIYTYFKKEHFENTYMISDFPTVNSIKYGLRHDRLNTSDIIINYGSPYRHIILNPTSGQMWESDKSPIDENIKGCSKIECPTTYTDYTKTDTCWQCAGSLDTQIKCKHYHIAPHVKI